MGQAPVTTATMAALRVVEDPFLGETACEVMRLSNLKRTGSPGPPCPRTDPRYRGSAKGVGLEKLVGPLRTYIGHRERPWALPALVGGAVLLIFYAGYGVGRGRRT
jgi:hypothetical protein